MKKAVRVTRTQQTAMLMFIEKNIDFHELCTTNGPMIMSEESWQSMADILNCNYGGCEKTWKEWVKTWNFWKYHTKLKSLGISRSNGKGLSQNRMELTNLEKQLIAFIKMVEIKLGISEESNELGNYTPISEASVMEPRKVSQRLGRRLKAGKFSVKQTIDDYNTGSDSSYIQKEEESSFITIEVPNITQIPNESEAEVYYSESEFIEIEVPSVQCQKDSGMPVAYKEDVHLNLVPFSADFESVISNSFEDHQAIRQISKFYRCNDCGYSSQSVKSIGKHLLVHVNKGKMLSCEKCDFTCERRAMLNNHRSTHQVIRKITRLYQCIHCSYNSPNVESIEKHLLVHVKKRKMFSCEKCNFTCGKRAILNSHRSTHLDHGLLQCTVCKLKLRNRKQNHTNMCKSCNLKIPYVLLTRFDYVPGNKGNTPHEEKLIENLVSKKESPRRESFVDKYSDDAIIVVKEEIIDISD